MDDFQNLTNQGFRILFIFNYSLFIKEVCLIYLKESLKPTPLLSEN